MSESSESDDGPANWTRQGRGTGKNSRKIVMRIEFDDSSSGSESASDEEPIIKPSGSGRRRQGGGGKRLISSDDDDSSSGSEITRTVVVRGRNNREDVMLLCDGCNRGYHMDCLSPALTEIPESFWYCDDCFQSEEEDLQEEMNVLMEDLREMGVPEQRLRVREVRQPRIPRTRQSERIRASIVARTRRSNRKTDPVG